jgi:hypothetical protein
MALGSKADHGENAYHMRMSATARMKSMFDNESPNRKLEAIID